MTYKDYLKHVVEDIEKTAKHNIQTAKAVADGADSKWKAEEYMEIYANERVLWALKRIKDAMEED